MSPSHALIAPAAITAFASFVACYQPEPQYGLPCSEELECPSGQRCITSAPGGPRCQVSASIDGAGGSPENDLAEGAIEVTRGGRFNINFTNASDNSPSSCAVDRPEVFYKLRITNPEVIYLDTFDLKTDTAIAVRPGPCTAAGAELACVDDSCGLMQSQGAWSLAAGEHCIIVEGPAAASSPDPERLNGKLEVVRGGQTGEPLTAASGMVSGDSCKDDDSNDAGCGCGPAKDHHYFFTVCPSTTTMVRLETCGSDMDAVLQLRNSNGGGLGCVDEDVCDVDNEILARTISSPGLFWAILDGCNDCGLYTMKYSLTSSPAAL